MKRHTVAPGDCVTSIAYESGFFWRTLWDHEDNQALKELRKNPFTLVPGDVVVVPDLQPREESCATAKRHTFRRRGVPARLNIRLLDHEGKPRPNEEYFLEVDGELRPNDKKADGDGWIRDFIPNDAQRGRLFLRGGDEVLELRFGRLEPKDGLSGAQARLANLGFYQGEIDGERSPALTAALERFRAAQKLPDTLGEDELIAAIAAAHEER
jgi:N-acetylmuramoyl-L-alanine amidase